MLAIGRNFLKVDFKYPFLLHFIGLWGTGTPFSDFNDFIQSIEKRGVGAMEIVAMDMKLRGMYMARQLSFSGVTFKIEEIPLQKEYVPRCVSV